jgi:hypothetical protein
VTGFEIVSLTYSFVLGLGIAQILSAALWTWLPTTLERVGIRDAAAILFFVAQAFALLFAYSSPTDVS